MKRIDFKIQILKYEMSNLSVMLSSNKLAAVIGKWCKIKKQKTWHFL